MKIQFGIYLWRLREFDKVKINYKSETHSLQYHSATVYKLGNQNQMFYSSFYPSVAFLIAHCDVHLLMHFLLHAQQTPIRNIVLVALYISDKKGITILKWHAFILTLAREK